MKTAKEMATLTKDALDKKREASKAVVDLAIEKFIMPTMMERACNGYTYAEICLEKALMDYTMNAHYVYWTENKGGWTRKKTEMYEVYIQDMVDYLKELGYNAYFVIWGKIFTVEWKEKEEK